MITMQVTDEDVIDAMKVRLNLHELNLRSLATVDEEGAVLYVHQLGRRMASICRKRTTGTQNGNFKTQPT